MFRAMEQLPTGEFTGFIMEAENEDDIVTQIANNYSEKTEWFVVNEDTDQEFIYNNEQCILEII